MCCKFLRKRDRPSVENPDAGRLASSLTKETLGFTLHAQPQLVV